MSRKPQWCQVKPFPTDITLVVCMVTQANNRRCRIEVLADP